MTLLDHFAQDAGIENNGYVRLPAHQFSDAIYLVANADFNLNQLITAFNLTEEPTADADETQLNEMVANYQAAKLISDLDGFDYIFKIERVLRLYEYGTINETKAKSTLGLA